MATDTLVLRVSGNSWQGSPTFKLLINGQQYGGLLTTTAAYANGEWQDIVVTGDFGGAQTVAINFNNDYWDGKNGRDLFVDKITLNGTVFQGEDANNTAGAGLTVPGAAPMYINGTLSFQTSNFLRVRVSGDAWQGPAAFVVLVDGKQVGGTYTTSAVHANGEWQDILITGAFSDHPNNIGISFVNNAWGATAAENRNLYVDSISLNGLAYQGERATSNTGAAGYSIPDGAVLMTNGTVTFNTKSTLHLRMSGDSGGGWPLFDVLVDGHLVAAGYTTTASHAAGEWQDIVIEGNFGDDPQAVEVRFTNDIWDPSQGYDRNLYIDRIDLNGVVYEGERAYNPAGAGYALADAAPMYVNGSTFFDTSGTLTLRVSGDAWQGDAQFTVKVDGRQIGNLYAATASHKLGQWQDITLTGNFGDAPKTVEVSFVNNAWGGSDDANRNLYLDKITLNGQVYEAEAAFNNASAGVTLPGQAALMSNGSVVFDTTLPDIGAVKFSAGQYVTVGNVAAYQRDHAWTGSAKIKVEAAPPQGGAELVFGNVGDAPYRGYELWIDDLGHARVRIMSSFLNSDYLGVGGTTNLADNKWHTLTATYDGSSKAAGVKLYVDGVLETTTVERDSLKGSIVSQSAMVIGNQLNGWENQYYLRGDIDWLTMSDVARSGEYVAAHLSGPDPLDANIVLSYNFDEGSGSTVYDASPHHYNGTTTAGIVWV